MSALTSADDLFARKDRKKKRAAAARSAQRQQQQKEGDASHDGGSAAVVDAGVKVKVKDVGVAGGASAVASVAGAGAGSAAGAAGAQDDGWVELEDVRGSQVNTGGRTVGEFRRFVSLYCLVRGNESENAAGRPSPKHSC